jgi:hypothetical protein
MLIYTPTLTEEIVILEKVVDVPIVVELSTAFV